MNKIMTLMASGALFVGLTGAITADYDEMAAMVVVIEDVIEVLDVEDPMEALTVATAAREHLEDMDVSPACVEAWAGFYVLTLSVETSARLLLEGEREHQASTVFDLMSVSSDDLVEPMDVCTDG